jgi:aryl-alcohol dehydrogenase-like predicted oxidoreductase
MSEVSVEQLERAHAIHPVASVQSELSLWTRGPLDDVLPWCRENDVAFFRARNPRFTREALEANLAIVERVRAVAERRGATPAQVALAWVLAQDERVLPIPGTTRPERVEENAGAAFLVLEPEDMRELDEAPAPAGARY